MAGSLVNFKVKNAKSFYAALERAKAAAKSLKAPLTLIAADFYRTQKDIWAVSGAGRYPDLSAAYKRRKQKKHGFVYPILRANGFLENAAAVQGGSGNITVITDKNLQLGISDSAIPYAAYHQSDAPRKKIPLRKFLFIGPEVPQFASAEQLGRVDRWKNILQNYLVTQAVQAGVGKAK